VITTYRNVTSAILAVAILAGAAGVAQAQTAAPTTAPLRVAVELHPGSSVPLDKSLVKMFAGSHQEWSPQRHVERRG
jgi:hypothetical protein